MYRRYVAIGDSTTEGLEDPDGQGGYRGWADRLAEHIADAQPEPLEYANLAVRGLKMHEIRTTQFDRALAMEPDLMTIFGGVNDAIGMRCDFGVIRTDYDEMFGQACRREVTVLTLTMPDPTLVNPLARHLKDRIFRLNEIIRTEADRHGALVVDFEQYPVASDPRLWFEDRLHGNSLGHERVAAALAWRLGIQGVDEAWSRALEEERAARRARDELVGNVDWAVHYLAPWIGRGIRRVPYSRTVTAKRPVPTVVQRPQSSRDNTSGRVRADVRAED
ncbi:MAG TPA: SGNH/GDSL hydrolase family protein [Propionibacteriaceae bacterium]|nr:SGNH/GDSL hydrolase family protein [Propionibacteriaceae bacterium]